MVHNAVTHTFFGQQACCGVPAHPQPIPFPCSRSRQVTLVSGCRNLAWLIGRADGKSGLHSEAAGGNLVAWHSKAVRADAACRTHSRRSSEVVRVQQEGKVRQLTQLALD